jgi:hypothetical protein
MNLSEQLEMGIVDGFLGRAGDYGLGDISGLSLHKGRADNPYGQAL